VVFIADKAPILLFDTLSSGKPICEGERVPGENSAGASSKLHLQIGKWADFKSADPVGQHDNRDWKSRWSGRL